MPATLPTACVRRVPREQRAPRVLILRAYPKPLSSRFYNCQETGLATFLAGRGVRVEIAAALEPGERQSTDDFDFKELSFYRAHPSLALIKNLNTLDFPAYDVVQLSDLHIPGNLQVLLRSRAATRFVIYQGHYREPFGKGRLLREMQTRLAAVVLRRRRHVALAKNAGAADLLEHHGLRRPSVIGVGLDAEKFRSPLPLPESVASFLESAARTFLYVGTIDYRRPVEWALEPLRTPQLADARMLIVGRGARADSVRLEFSDLIESGRVLFVEHMEQTQLASVYRKVDTLVLPTRYEIYGMVCMEGVLFGLPIVASDVPGPGAVAQRFPDAVSLVPGEGDPAAWTQAMIRAVARGRNRASSRADVESDLSWERPGEAFLEAIYRLAAAPYTSIK